MESRKKVENISGKVLWLDAGILMLLLLLFCLTIPTVAFFVGGTIASWMFPVAMLCALGVWIGYFHAGERLGKPLMIVLVELVIVIGLALMIYDISWDGNTYHKTAIGLLMDGWNPIHMQCMDQLSVDKKTEGMAYNAQWINHYANGGWTMAAVLASLFGNIEAGKAINGCFLCALFGIGYWFLSRKLGKRWMAAGISFLAVCNPITLSQIESFYIDGDLYLCILLALVGILCIHENLPKRYGALFLFAAIVMSCNLKFTGAVYVGVFCTATYLFELLQVIKGKERKRQLLTYTVRYLAMAVVAIGLFGYSSYVCNVLEKGNPLFPLVGEDRIEIMSYSEPSSFAGLSTPEKSLRSLFGKSANIAGTSAKKAQLKLPFMVSLSEIKTCMNTDTRVAGYGVFFSGIFLIAVLVNILYLWRKRRCVSLLMKIVYIWLFASLGIFLFVPGSWWMRYSAHLYLWVIVALVLMVKKLSGCRKTPLKALFVLFVCLLIGNTSLFLLAPASGVYRSLDIWQDKRRLVQESEQQAIEIRPMPYHMTGIYWNLDAWGVEYQVNGELQSGMPTYHELLMWSEKK